MLKFKQSSFLSQSLLNQHSSTEPKINKQNSYNFQSFILLLKSFQHYIKTKRQTNQTLKSYLHHMKKLICQKIDKLIQKSDQSIQILTKQLQSKYNQIKRINQTYTNQFIETLEQIFSEQYDNNDEYDYGQQNQNKVKLLFKRYSIENQNPFRKIQEKVKDITTNVNKLCQIDWNYLQKDVYQKVVKGNLFDQDKVFIIKETKQRERNNYNDKMMIRQNQMNAYQRSDEDKILLNKNNQQYNSSCSQQTHTYSPNINNGYIMILPQSPPSLIHSSQSIRIFISYSHSQINLFSSQPQISNQNINNPSQYSSFQSYKQNLILLDKLKLDNHIQYDMIYSIIEKQKIVAVSYNLITVFKYEKIYLKENGKINRKIVKDYDLNIKGSNDIKIQNNNRMLIQAMNQYYLIDI